MALTVIVRLGERPDERDPVLMLDAPRIVIGRSANCEIWLPDPSVSMRHACIRRSKGKTVVVDEGSTNGTVVAGSRLPPQTPHTLRDGEYVRIGRVWLQIQLAAGVTSGVEQVHAVAMTLVERVLEREGAPSCPQLVVAEGPDEARRFTMAELGRDYVVGRSEEADFVLTDDAVSRRHLGVERAGTGVMVRDLGTRDGSWLQGIELPRDRVPWDDGQLLALGSTTFQLHDPLAAALSEMMEASDAKMASAEYEQRPPLEPEVKVADEPAAPGEESEPRLLPTDTFMAQVGDDPIGGVDIVVVLLALGLLLLSAAGLYLLLG